MTPRLFRWLVLPAVFALPAAPANIKAQGGPPVTAYMTGKNAALANGIVTATIDPGSATILSLRYQGLEMISQTGRHKTIYFSMNGDKGYTGFSGCTFSITTRTSDMVDISCKSVYSPERPKMYPCDVDIHYVLRRGESGLYVYALLDHPAGYPELNANIFRLVWSMPEYQGNWLMEKIYVDAARHWSLPTPADFAKAEATPIKEITKLTTGAWKGKYDCKYMYSANYWDLGCWGFASDRNKIGAWAVSGSHEFFNDGPTLQDLTSASGLFHVEFEMQHYNSSKIVIPKSEVWQKIYGPILLYCNSNPDGADACWADAKRQSEVEQAAWPYNWLHNEHYYPLKNGRGTVAGKFVVRDRLQPDVSGADAWVGLDQPDPGGNWQFDSKHYQYWVHADADGNFSIPDVRPGTYTLYAFTTGAVGEFSKTNTAVKADGTTSLGDVTWNVPHPGASIAWEIGVPDRTAKEFRHGDDYFRPYLWQQFAREFSNPLDYTVGASDWSKDWNYAQCGYLKDGVWTPWKWRIHFALTNVPTAGDATLTIAYADANRGHTEIYVNDENKLFKLVTPAIEGGNALIREGIHAKYRVERVPIPVSLLKTGANTITLVVPPGRNNLPFSHVMYDYLNLELPANPSAGN
jgi:Polysaccharide lyase family 4, domain III/Polysaccharide lyase family 4, domain II/Rhamnogalacturonate lyase family